MKKLLITSLLLTPPLIGNATLIAPKTNPVPQPVVKAAPTAQVADFNNEEEDDDDDTEALPVAAQTQTSVQSKTNQPTPPISSQPTDTSTITESIKKESPVVVPEGDTRQVAFFNKTGHTITLYGKSSGDTTSKLLTTLTTNSAPAQIVTIPVDIDTIFVEDQASNILTLEQGEQLITIAIASSIGSFTYTLDTVVPVYPDHTTIYNATNTNQIVIMQTSAKVPGIFSSTTTTQKYAYTIPAQTMLLITIPQLGLPATQDKKVQCGLPNSETPLTINSDEQNMFIVTQDNGTPVLHKI